MRINPLKLSKENLFSNTKRRKGDDITIREYTKSPEERPPDDVESTAHRLKRIQPYHGSFGSRRRENLEMGVRRCGGEQEQKRRSGGTVLLRGTPNFGFSLGSTRKAEKSYPEKENRSHLAGRRRVIFPAQQKLGTSCSSSTLPEE